MAFLRALKAVALMDEQLESVMDARTERPPAEQKVGSKWAGLSVVELAEKKSMPKMMVEL